MWLGLPHLSLSRGCVRFGRKTFRSHSSFVLTEQCPSRRRVLPVLPLLQPTHEEWRMLRAAMDGNLAAVQALLEEDRALARCKVEVRCRTALISGLLRARRICQVLVKSTRSEDQAVKHARQRQGSTGGSTAASWTCLDECTVINRMQTLAATVLCL